MNIFATFIFSIEALLHVTDCT